MWECNLTNVLCSHCKNDSISYYNFTWNKLKICILSKYKEAIKKQIETVSKIFSNEFSKTYFQKQQNFKNEFSKLVEWAQ